MDKTDSLAFFIVAMKIFVLEKNYAASNKSGDGSLYTSDAPIVSIKADSALLKDGKPFFVPDWSEEVVYGAAVVVRICRLGKSIPTRFAHRYYDAVTVGVDFTARDLQRKLRSAGLPWELSKGFDGAATLGEWVSKDKFLDIQALHFRLDINGVTVQQGRTSDMLHKIDDTIAYLSRFFTLKTGDMIYTGTPSEGGVAHIDDHVTGYVEDRKVLEFNCK